jgi:hypothetical protein
MRLARQVVAVRLSPTSGTGNSTTLAHDPEPDPH